MNRILLALCALLFLLASQEIFSQTLPVEIDYVGARAIYDANLKISSLARQSSNVALDDLNNSKSMLERNLVFIETSKNNIAHNNSRISSFGQENATLRAENSRLEDENQNLSSQKNRLHLELSRMQSQENELKNSLASPLRQREEVQNNLLYLQRQIENLDSELKSAERRHKQNERESDDKKRDLRDLENEAVLARRQIPEIRQNIKNNEQKISSTKSQIDSLNSEKSRFQRDLTTLQNEERQALADFKQAKNNLDLVKNEIAPLQNELNQVESRQIKIDNEIRSLKLNLSTKNSELANLKSSRQSLPREITNLKQVISNAQSRISNIRNEVQRFNTEISQINSRYDSIQREIEVLRSGPIDDQTRAKLVSLRQELKDLASQRQVKTSSINELNNEVTRLNSEISKAEISITNKERELANLDQSILSVQNQISQIDSKIPTLESESSHLTRQASSIKSKIATYDSQIRVLEQQVSSKKEVLRRIESKISETQSNIERVMNQLSQIQNLIRDLEIQNNRFAQDMSRLQDRLERIKSELQNTQDAITRLQRLIREDEEQISKLSLSLSNLLSRQDSFKRELENVNMKISRIEYDLNQVQTSISSVENQILSANRQLDFNLSLMNSNDSKIKSNDRDTYALENENRNLLSQINVAAAENEKISYSLPRLEENYSKLNESALRLENVTNDSLAIYNQKKELYDSYDEQAKKLGASQSSRSSKDLAIRDGQRNVEEVSTRVGVQIGQILGGLDGQLRGLELGLKNGEIEGRQAGENSKDDFELGFKEGYTLGEKKSLELAKLEEVPRGHNEMVERLVSKAESFLNEFNKNFESSFDLNEKIQKIKADILKFNQEDNAKSKPQYAYVSPSQIVVDTKDRDCSIVYKNVEALRLSCEKSYALSFKVNYESDYKKIFFDSYEELYWLSRNATFENTKELKFDESYKMAYEIIFLEAKALGAKVAYSKGFSEGEQRGFVENIDEFRKEFFEKGVELADEFYAKNSLVRVSKKASPLIRAISEKGLLQGSEFSLDFGVHNFGGAKSTDTDVLIEVVSLTNNVTLNSTRAYISGVGAKSSLKLLDVFKGIISPSALPGSEISIIAKITYPKNALDEVISEVIKFNEKVKVNPEVNMQTHFDSSVEWRDWKVWPVKWVYRTHSVKVNLKGLRDNVPGDYKISLEILKGSNYIKVNANELMAASPRKDEESSVNFKYTFRKEAKKQELKFRVQVSYNQELLKEEFISVKVDQ